jgi:hypothetical protein
VRTDQPAAAAAEAQTAPVAAPQGLTAEQRAFFDSSERSGALKSIITGAIQQTIEARTESGALTRDAQRMVDQYGADINSEDEATRSAARERVAQDMMASIYTLISSRRVSDARRLRRVWTISASGTGESFRISIERASRVRAAVRQHITDELGRRGTRR